MASDPRTRFSAPAEDYGRHRPTYPRELIDWLLAEAGLDGRRGRVADVGCGTGISTRLLAERGHDVVGIDPNEDMLERARARGGGARYARGEAAATGLPDGSVDLVTVAQAFHWFDRPRALAELSRVLLPPRPCAAFWNVRARTPFMDEYEALLRRFSSEYAGVPRPEPTLSALETSPGVSGARRAEFLHAQVLDRDGLLGRARSSSYVAHGVADLGAFEEALSAAFARHQRDGRIELPYRAVALAFRVTDPGAAATASP